MSPEVSVIIVNYNCGELLQTCIRSVYAQTTDLRFEIIVVDNASADNSMQELVQAFPNVKAVYNADNKGFGAANNIGAQHASGTYLLLLNPDTILCNNAIKILYDRAQGTGEKLGCCGGNLLDEHRAPANIGGHFPTLFQLFSDIGFRFFYKKYYRKNVSLMSTVDDLRNGGRIEAVCGADLLIEKARFEEIGGFDEAFFLYFEDTDLCYRLVRAGYKNFIFPEAEILHLESAVISSDRSDKLDVRKFTFFETSKQLFFRKKSGAAAVVAVKLLTVLYLLTRWIAHRGKAKNYLLMMRNTLNI